MEVSQGYVTWSRHSVSENLQGLTDLLYYNNVCSVMSDSLWPHGLYPTRILCPWDSPGKNTEEVCHFLLQGIFLTQRPNPHLLCLLHWQMDCLPTDTCYNNIIIVDEPCPWPFSFCDKKRGFMSLWLKVKRLCETHTHTHTHTHTPHGTLCLYFYSLLLSS